MRPEALTVFVVDDDPSIRDSLQMMLKLLGYNVAVFADAEAFLGAWHEEWCGCLVTDLRLPKKSGLELQTALRELRSPIPVIVITAHGDVASARSAFRANAVDFLEKPFDQEQFRNAIEAAFALEERRLHVERSRRSDAAKLDTLTSREREVLEYAARGLHAKEIGASLGISPRTVEVHKTRIMEKLGVRNLAELVRFAVAASRE